MGRTARASALPPTTESGIGERADGPIHSRRPYRQTLLACVLAIALIAGGARLISGPTSRQPAPPAPAAPQLVTYQSGSACFGVRQATPIAKVPAGCAQAWRYYRVTDVPGQDLLARASVLPPIERGSGVGAAEAQALAIAFWRTESFKNFAVASSQPAIVDGLGPHYFFLRTSREVQAVIGGAQVPTPACHEFPSSLRVTTASAKMLAFLKRSGRVLELRATYAGPCRAVATYSGNKSIVLYDWAGSFSVLFVGDITRGSDPLGRVLALTGLADCTEPVAAADCVA